MNEPEKKIPKSLIFFVVLTVIGLFIILVAAASFGDDVPSELPPAAETSPGN